MPRFWRCVQTTAADIAILRTAGLPDEEIVDAVQVVGFFNWINRVAEGLGVDPEPDWSPA